MSARGGQNEVLALCAELQAALRTASPPDTATLSISPDMGRVQFSMRVGALRTLIAIVQESQVRQSIPAMDRRQAALRPLEAQYPCLVILVSGVSAPNDEIRDEALKELQALSATDREHAFAAGAAATIAMNYRALRGSAQLPSLDDWNHLAGDGS